MVVMRLKKQNKISVHTNLSIVTEMNLAPVVHFVQDKISLQCLHGMWIPLAGMDKLGARVDQIGKYEVTNPWKKGCGRECVDLIMRMMYAFNTKCKNKYMQPILLLTTEYTGTMVTCLLVACP